MTTGADNPATAYGPLRHVSGTIESLANLPNVGDALAANILAGEPDIAFVIDRALLVFDITAPPDEGNPNFTPGLHFTDGTTSIGLAAGSLGQITPAITPGRYVMGLFPTMASITGTPLAIADFIGAGLGWGRAQGGDPITGFSGTLTFDLDIRGLRIPAAPHDL